MIGGFARLLLECLEDRLTPAFATFVAGAAGGSVQDTQISALAPAATAALAQTLTVSNWDSADGANQTLLRFDNLIGAGSGQIPGTATVVSASLRLWALGSGLPPTSIGFHPMLVPWQDSSATWQGFGNGIQTNDIEASATATATATMNSGGWVAVNLPVGQIVNGSLGWVLWAPQATASWSFASSDNADPAHRPTLTVNYQIAGQSNPSYIDLVGAPPEVTKLAWFDWQDDLRDERIARVPLDRGNTYYFSQAGDDVTGAGTVAQPWKTVAKAQQVLDQSAGDVRLRFRRGDVWRETTASLNIFRDGVSIDDYGDTALAKPILSRFVPISNSSWEWVDGNLYKVTAPPAVGWLREAADGFTNIYYRAASSAEVTNRMYSWFYDATGTDPRSGGLPTLYANGGGDLTNLAGGLEYCPNDGLGWETWGDNLRFENVRLEGQGISTDGQSYGLKINQRYRWEFVGIGLEVYYTGYHAIGQIVRYADGHGAATLVNCQAGLCVNRFGNGQVGSGDITVFVAYGDYGGNEYIQDHCTMAFGALPSADWGAGPGLMHGQGLYTHSGVSAYLDLVIVVGTAVGPAVNPLSVRNHIDSAMPASSLGGVRAYIVEDVPGRIESNWHSPDVAIVNCIIDRTSVPAVALSGYAFSHGSLPIGSWLVNCTVKIDTYMVPGWYSAFYLVRSGVDSTHYINCHFDFFNAQSPLFVRNFLESTDASDMWITNSIISFQGSGINGIGPVGHLQNNAYYVPNIQSVWNYAQDAGAVTLASRFPIGVAPSQSSTLANGGLDVGLEYDQKRRPRSSSTEIGPLAAEALPDPVNVTYGWGGHTAQLASASVLAQATIDRITLKFPKAIDVGSSTFVISDANGPLPIASFANNYLEQTATWTLAAPLPRGHYQLVFNGQSFMSFAVLPGDFDGSGLVDLGDMSLFRHAFNTNAILFDLDGGGSPDLADFARFRGFYGAVL